MIPTHHPGTKSGRAGFAALLLLAVLCLLAGRAAAEPTYLDYEPLATISATSLKSVLDAAGDGLPAFGGGSGGRSPSALAGKALFLPALDGVAEDLPFSCFYLTTDPPAAFPVPACYVPVEEGMGWKITDSFRRAYRTSEGSALRHYTSPVSTNAPPSVYVAIVDGHALISPRREGLRWLALKSRDRSVPRAERFREAPVHVSVDGRLASELCKALGSLLPKGEARLAGAGSRVASLRELAVFLSAFTTLDLAVAADGSSWDVSARVTYPPSGAFARAMSSAGPPDGNWTKLFPGKSSNHSASALPAFVRNLPESNRRFLSRLAGRSNLAGFHLLPSAPDADDKLFPAIGGLGAFAFVSDSERQFVGSVSVYRLSRPTEAEVALQAYFSDAGGITRNAGVKAHGIRQSGGKQVFTYDILPPTDGNQTAIEQSAMVFTALLEMDHVEVAVSGDRLFVARGRHGLIDRWLSGKGAPSSAPSVRLLRRGLPSRGEETPLGGGVLEPAKVIRGALAFLPDFSEALEKAPLPGDGISWNMSRTPGSTIFDFRFPGGEIAACLAIGALNDACKGDFMTQFFIRRLGEEKPEPSR